MRRILWVIFSVLILWTGATGTANAQEAQSDPHEQLRDILKRPLYKRWQLRQDQADESGEDSPLAKAAQERAQQVVDSIGARLRDLFPRRGGAAAGAAAARGVGGLMSLFWVIAWVAVALFVLAIIVLIYRLMKMNQNTVVSAAVLSREQVATALKHGNALAMEGDQWLEEAGRLAAQKNFRAMYRALYLALLSGLHTVGKIDFNRHHTNWTYVQRYRGEPREREVFSRLTELFDGVWYGLENGEGTDLGRLKQQVQVLIRPMPDPTARAGSGAGVGR